MAKRISFTRSRFDLELAVSDSWPPLWFIDSKSGFRHYQLLGVETWAVDGFACFQIIAGPFAFSLTVFYGGK